MRKQNKNSDRKAAGVKSVEELEHAILALSKLRDEFTATSLSDDVATADDASSSASANVSFPDIPVILAKVRQSPRERIVAAKEKKTKKSDYLSQPRSRMATPSDKEKAGLEKARKEFRSKLGVSRNIYDENILELADILSIEEGHGLGNSADFRSDDFLDRLKDSFNASLDAILFRVRNTPQLKEALRAHEIFSEIVEMSRAENEDPFAAEIARKVTIRWEDRKKPEYRGQPWTKNASTFISQVYAKWISQGTMRLSYLKADGKLYKAYHSLITRAPEWDLILLKNEYTKLDDPEQALAHFRYKSRQTSRRYAKKRLT